jgi:Spy/CpxP family protein refolding chaperone
MMIKRLLLLSALPLMIGGVGFTAPSNAQANESAVVAQNAPQPNGQREGRGKKYEQLNLTDAQKAQIQQIKQSTRQQMDAVFTPEQKEQLRVAREQKQRPNLTLTDAQKAQLKAIRESSKTQMDAVFTPEQKQKLSELHQQWRQNRQNRQQQPTNSST